MENVYGMPARLPRRNRGDPVDDQREHAIGKLTAEKMEEHRLVVWGQHGIYGSGENFDEALGLIETAEKAAEIYLKIRQFPIEESIGDGDLKDLAEAYRLSFRADYLDLGTTEKIYGCKKSS